MNEYIFWFNAQYDRRRCPVCDEPVYATLDGNDELTITLDHKSDCELMKNFNPLSFEELVEKWSCR